MSSSLSTFTPSKFSPLTHTPFMQLDLDALYSSSPADPYFYQGGWNPAALAALLLGALPTLPGLAHALG